MLTFGEFKFFYSAARHADDGKVSHKVVVVLYTNVVGGRVGEHGKIGFRDVLRLKRN